MLDAFINENYDLFLSDGSHLLNIKQIKVHFNQAKSTISKEEYLAQLNTLATAYIFHESKMKCADSRSGFTVLHGLKSPKYRSSVIKFFPHLIHLLLRHDALTTENAQLSKELHLSPLMKEKALLIANQTPFALTNHLFIEFAEIEKTFSKSNFLALLCTVFLQQHCLDMNSSVNEIDLFHQGVCSGFISLKLAEANSYSALRSFLTTLLHSIALLYLQQELDKHQSLPSAKELLFEINELHFKLTYWIAKDWGLPDDILDSLKQRFMTPENLSFSADIMQRSEHAHLAIMLYQDRLLSYKKTLSFLNAMELAQHCVISPTSTCH